MKKTKAYYKRVNYILNRTLDRIHRQSSNYFQNKKISAQKNKKEQRQESYTFIPHSTSLTINQLIIAHKHLIERKDYKFTSYLNFLDAGCGTGNIILLANAVGFYKAYGLEFDPEIIKLANIINPMCDNIIQQDILTYNMYDLYDVIYYYCPFCNPKKQTKFEELVEDQMKVGALLIANFKQSKKILKNKRFCRIETREHNIYEKVSM